MGYEEAPWRFKGKALYQLSLVKVEEAQKYVPPELPLVNFFGWTLGGFYLARYSHSPVGAFDEMVAMAGLAWNFPASCAWAARVYVNNREARDHGIQAVGLPSRLASFRALPLRALSAGSRAPAAGAPGAAPPLAHVGGGAAGGNSSGGGASSGGSSGSGGGGGGGGSSGEGSLLDRTLAKFQSAGGTWWDSHHHGHHHQQQQSRGGGKPASGGNGGGHTGSGSSGAGGSGAAPLLPGTWAVELSNEEPRRRGGLLRFLPFGRRRGGTTRGLAGGPVCRIELPPQPKGLGPRISMCLPSFSGATPDYPGFLQYDLKLQANIRPVPTARLAFPEGRPEEAARSPEVLDCVLGGRPLLCLEFADMEMDVQAPVPWRPKAL